MSKEMKAGNERPPYQTIEDVIKQAKEILLTYHWHKPTIILEGSIKTITGNFRELLPDFSVQVQQMLEAGVEVGKNEDIGTVEQAFLVSQVTFYEQKSISTEVLQVSHCEIRSKKVTTKSLHIVYEGQDKVVGFHEHLDEDNPLINQDKALINTFIRGYLQGILHALVHKKG